MRGELAQAWPPLPPTSLHQIVPKALLGWADRWRLREDVTVTGVSCRAPYFSDFDQGLPGLQGIEVRCPGKT